MGPHGNLVVGLRIDTTAYVKNSCNIQRNSHIRACQTSVIKFRLREKTLSHNVSIEPFLRRKKGIKQMCPQMQSVLAVMGEESLVHKNCWPGGWLVCNFYGPACNAKLWTVIIFFWCKVWHTQLGGLKCRILPKLLERILGRVRP